MVHDILLYLFMLLKVTEKISSDRNTQYNTIYRLLDYCHCTVLLPLLSPHRPIILGNICIDWFIWIK